jgi:hypothetical protein
MIVLLALLLSIAVQAPMTQSRPGMWASAAAYLWPGPTAIADYPAAGLAIDVISPDSSMVLSLRDAALRVRRTGEGRTAIGAPITVDGPAEVMWAPDSRAFTLTWTDGGWVGSWQVSVYRVSDDSIERVDVAREAFRAFRSRSVKHKGKCAVEEPNMAAAAWVGGSNHLLLLAEAPPHSSACDMGTIHGYTVDVATGKIIAQYNQADVRRLFRERLGTRFR